jgi:hypothetical protein
MISGNLKVRRIFQMIVLIDLYRYLRIELET